MSLYSLGWLLIFGAGLIYELYTVVDDRRGNTLSETVWRLNRRWWFRFLLVTGLAWLAVHLLTGWV